MDGILLAHKDALITTRLYTVDLTSLRFLPLYLYMPPFARFTLGQDCMVTYCRQLRLQEAGYSIEVYEKLRNPAPQNCGRVALWDIAYLLMQRDIIVLPCFASLFWPVIEKFNACYILSLLGRKCCSVLTSCLFICIEDNAPSFHVQYIFLHKARQNITKNFFLHPFNVSTNV